MFSDLLKLFLVIYFGSTGVLILGLLLAAQAQSRFTDQLLDEQVAGQPVGVSGERVISRCLEDGQHVAGKTA